MELLYVWYDRKQKKPFFFALGLLLCFAVAMSLRSATYYCRDVSVVGSLADSSVFVGFHVSHPLDKTGSRQSSVCLSKSILPFGHAVGVSTMYVVMIEVR